MLFVPGNWLQSDGTTFLPQWYWSRDISWRYWIDLKFSPRTSECVILTRKLRSDEKILLHAHEKHYMLSVERKNSCLVHIFRLCVVGNSIWTKVDYTVFLCGLNEKKSKNFYFILFMSQRYIHNTIQYNIQYKIQQYDLKENNVIRYSIRRCKYDMM